MNALRAHVVLVIAIIAVTVAAAAFGVTQRSATYEATADLLLTPLPSGDQTHIGLQLLRESNDPTRLAQTAAALIESPQAAQATADELGEPYTRRRVEEDVEVEPKGQSNIVSVTAKASKPAAAEALANTFVEESLAVRAAAVGAQARRLIAALRASSSPDSERIAQLQSLAAGSDPTISLATPAELPTDATGRQAWLVIVLAAMAGFVIASGAALLAEFANRRVRDEDEIVSVFPLPVLARIPKVRRDQRGTGAGRSPGLREAFRTLQLQLDDHGAGGRGRVVTITSATRYDGKTSCAIGLGLALADSGYRVLLIDLDTRNPELGRRLGFNERDGLAWLLDAAHPKRLEDTVVSYPSVPNLQVLCAGSASPDVLDGARFARLLPAVLDAARARADFVILDTSPLGQVSDALRVIPQSDDVLVVCRPGCTRPDDLAATRQLIERAQVTPRGIIVVGVGKPSHYAYGT